jgi:hypothetical protein
MGFPYKYRKPVIITTIIIIAICFYGSAFYNEHKAKQKFFALSFSGIVVEKIVKKYDRGSTSIKLSTGDWQHLGLYYDDQKFMIEIGDSIFKNKNSFNIFIKAKDGTINNCIRERYKNKTFKKD